MTQNYNFKEDYHLTEISPFEHEVGGVKYIVEATVLFAPKAKNPQTRDDFYEDFSVEEIYICDTMGNDFTDTIVIEDDVLRKQMFFEEEHKLVQDLSGLTMKHVADEKWWYYEKFRF